MKWLLLFLLPLSTLAQSLPTGTYRDLKPNQPLVLDTGSFTFIGLEMKDLGKGIWLDGRKARSLTVLNSRFEGKHSGTAIATNNHATITNCIFKNLEKGICATVLPNPSKKKTQSRTGNTFTGLDYGILVPSGTATTTTPYSITGNTFDGNRYGVYLGNGSYNLQLKCNVFQETEEIPVGNTHIGLEISENVSIEGNRIGGDGSPQIPGTPNANRWPLSNLTWNSTTTPTTIDGFVSIWNKTEEDIEYWRYNNEFFGAVSNTNGGSIVSKLLSPTNVNYIYSAVDLCQLSGNNCDLGADPSNLTPCIAAVQANNSCPGYTLPTGITWIRACEESPVDFEPWPFFARPAQPNGDVTSSAAMEVKPALQLGQSQPNPGKTNIQIPFFLPEESGKTELWITDVSTGRLVDRRLINGVGEGKLEIGLSGYSTGIFAYKLIPEKGKASQTMKFVVIR